MSDKKRKEELKEKYEAIFSGEQKRLKSNKIDHDFGMYKLFIIIIIIIIEVNMIKFNFKLQI